MAFITYIFGQIISYWSWIAVVAIILLTSKWILSKKKNKIDPFLGLPEIKPHWLWGNVGSIFGDEHFAISYSRHYKVSFIHHLVHHKFKSV